MKKCKIPARYLIMFMLFMTTYINYTTKANFPMSLSAMVEIVDKDAVQKPPICKENDPNYSLEKSKSSKEEKSEERYKWTQNTQALVLGAFYYGFVPISLPAGLIAEWLGPFWTLFISVVVCGVLNSVCVWAAELHWGYLFTCRFIMGLAGGLAYPALQCLIARWAPPEERSKFVGALSGNTLGNGLTYIIVGFVTKKYGWRWGFHVVTMEHVIFMILFWFLVSDSPEQSRLINEEELKYIKESQHGTVTKTRAVPPYLEMLKSLPFWILVLFQFGNLWGLYVQMNSVPKFMTEAIGFNIQESGIFVSLPHFIRVFTGLAFGAAGDYFKNHHFNREIVLKVGVVFSHILPGLIMGCMGLVKCHDMAAVALLCLSMSFNGAVVITNLQNPTDLSPNFAGTIMGIMTLVAGTTGFIVPKVASGLIYLMGNTFKAWTVFFIIGGSMYCFFGVLFIIFGTSKTQPWNEKKQDAQPSAQQNTNLEK